MKTKHCSWCDNSFKTNVAYQIYCSPECREAATKEKIAARYLAIKRNKKSTKERTCKSCGKRLSVYNDETICQTCEVNPIEVNKALKDIKDIANDKYNDQA
jgi:hypothetical protein